MKKTTKFNLHIASELAVVLVMGLLMFGYFRGQQATIVTTGSVVGETMILSLNDPVGDDKGPGSYTYPRHTSFEPQEGLLDLLGFRVINKGTAAWYELDFGLITNPWQAPEGFFHQRVDIYIDSREGFGRVLPAFSGSNVTFSPKYPWDLWIRVAPWGGSRAYYLEKDGGKLIERRGVEVGTIGDRTLRIIVPPEVLPLPRQAWRYYVLVGGYDGFGPDGYRVVTANGGEWIFGGGTDANIDANVIDLLAPRGGKHSQAIQLGYNSETKSGPVLYPVGNVKNGTGAPWIIGALLLLAGGVGVGFWQQSKRQK